MAGWPFNTPMSSLTGGPWATEPPNLAMTTKISSMEPEVLITYRRYRSEADLPSIMSLVGSELSEPYVIYTYRYFLVKWPHLAFLAFANHEDVRLPDSSDPGRLPERPIGVIVCKQDMHRGRVNRGYIAMLSVDKQWRKRGIASALVQRSIDAMKLDGAREVVLETEADNFAALSFYASMGFMREKRLYRFYMNGKDAFRLVLPIPGENEDDEDMEDEEDEESEDETVLSHPTFLQSTARHTNSEVPLL